MSEIVTLKRVKKGKKQPAQENTLQDWDRIINASAEQAKPKKKRKLRTLAPIPLEEKVQEPVVITADPGIERLKARLESILARMADLKAEAKDLGTRIGNEFNPLEVEAIDIMRELYEIDPSMSTAGLDTAYKGADAEGILIQKQTPVVDYEGIKPHVSREVWLEITTRVGDDKKLAAAIELGHVPAELVAHHTTYTPQKAYVIATRPKQPGVKK